METTDYVRMLKAAIVVRPLANVEFCPSCVTQWFSACEYCIPVGKECYVHSSVIVMEVTDVM
jgi:hypothetical protein